MSVRHQLSVSVLLFALASPLLAAPTEYRIAIKDHRFQPSELVVPAGEKIKLVIENQDATPEEFESHELNREKVVPGHSKITIYLGPLKPGTYPFFGEFNPKTASGKLIVK